MQLHFLPSNFQASRKNVQVEIENENGKKTKYGKNYKLGKLCENL